MKISRIEFDRRWALAATLGAALIVGNSLSLTAAGQNSDTRVDQSVKVGQGLYEVVLSESTNTVYVASSAGEDGAKIFALDAETLETKRTIDVASAPAFGLGLNDRTQTLYTSNTRTGTASAIDLQTGQIVATLALESEPTAHLYRVLVDEEANKVYMSMVGSPGGVWIVDGATNELEHVIENVGDRPTGLALDRDANLLYVACQGENAIAVIDLESREVLRKIPTGGERSTQILLDSTGDRLFVTNQTTGDLTVLDTDNGNVLATVPTGEVALAIGFDADAGEIYVGNRGSGTLTVIDDESYEVKAQIDAGTMPNTIAVDDDDNRIYLTNKAARGVAPEDDAGGDTVMLIVP